MRAAQRGRAGPKAYGPAGLLFGAVPKSYIFIFIIVLFAFQSASWFFEASTAGPAPAPRRDAPDSIDSDADSVSDIPRRTNADVAAQITSSQKAAAAKTVSGTGGDLSNGKMLVATPDYYKIVELCDDSCPTAKNGICEDGDYKHGSKPSCDLGTDCSDCKAKRKVSQDYANNLYIRQMQKDNIAVHIGETITKPPFLMAFTDPQADRDVSEAMYNGRMVERGETLVAHKILSQYCPPGADGKPGLFVDVGANFGYYAIYAARHGCRVKAYEPVPLIYRFLRLNVELNGLHHLVETFPYAVGNESTPIRVYQVDPKERKHDTNWGTASTIYSGNDRPFNLAKQVKLDEEIPSDKIALLKVDVEGYEPSVFVGAQRLISERRVLNLLMEYSPGQVMVHYAPSRMQSFPLMLIDLIEAGFEMGVMLDPFSKGSFDVISQTPYIDFDGPRTKLPPFQRVTMRVLRYDVADVRRLIGRPMTMGGLQCTTPGALDILKEKGFDQLHFYANGCGRVPEDLDPRSLHSLFGFNTNIIASLRGRGMKLAFRGEAAMFDRDDDILEFFGKGFMGSGMRLCFGFPNEDVALAHRCPCESFKKDRIGNSPKCKEKEELLRELARKGMFGI